MPDPKTVLGLAYKLYEHLSVAADCRSRGQREYEAEQNKLANECVEKLRDIGEQRSEMLAVCGNALDELCPAWCREKQWRAGKDCPECRDFSLRERLCAVIAAAGKRGEGNMIGIPHYDIPEDLLPPWCSAQLSTPYHVKWGGNEWIVRVQWIVGVLGRRMALFYLTENLLKDQGALRQWFEKIVAPELHKDVQLVNAQWSLQKKIGRALGVPEHMLPLRNMGYSFMEEVRSGVRWRDAGLRLALRVLWRVVVRARPDLANY